MFDDITCKYPLPLPEFQNRSFQTKDTPRQFLDRYEIREDGTLWHEDYDVEDHSEHGNWKREHPGQEPPKELSFSGCMARVNKRWEQVGDFTGEVTFYGFDQEEIYNHTAGWVEFSAYFLNGKIQQLNLVRHRKPEK